MRCAPDWSSPFILIFDDSDGDHRLGQPDKLINKSKLPGGRWHWRGSNRAYLRFRADGTPMEWGRFTLCPFSNDVPNATQLVLNVVGRPYTIEATRQQLRSSQLCL